LARGWAADRGSEVKYGQDAIAHFCSDPLPPAGTPEYLARLVPVERTCAAAVKVGTWSKP